MNYSNSKGVGVTGSAPASPGTVADELGQLNSAVTELQELVGAFSGDLASVLRDATPSAEAPRETAVSAIPPIRCLTAAQVRNQADRISDIRKQLTDMRARLALA